jgi:hypothetical protein
MSKLEKPPIYTVAATPEEWAAAKVAVEAKKLDPFTEMGAGYRKAALRATINSGMPISLRFAAEFRTYLDALGYQEAANARATAELKKKREEAASRPHRFRRAAEAAAVMDPWAYNAWCASPEGQRVMREESDAILGLR